MTPDAPGARAAASTPDGGPTASAPGARAAASTPGARAAASLDPADARLALDLDAGDGWTHVLAAGETLRVVDLHGNQAVDTLFFDAHDYANRYSAADTLREQGSAYLTLGSRLLALDGAPLVTITADTCGRHDTLGGACSQESNVVRYGEHTRHMHACRNTFLAQALAWGSGLDKRDLGANVNFFMNVPLTPEGGLTFEDGVSAPGKYVQLRADRDTLVLISNCPQLNNPCNGYDPTPVRLLVWSAP
jgi:urea carboxylase-associated protein 1